MSMKEVRIEIGGDILIAMAANDEFPMGNVHRVTRVMNEYFQSEGFQDVLDDLGSSWTPTEDYWMRHLKEVREYLRQNKKLFLEFERNQGLTGSWKFLRKGEFESVMKRERAGLTTRVETYNDKIDDGSEKWKKLAQPRLRMALN